SASLHLLVRTDTSYLRQVGRFARSCHGRQVHRCDVLIRADWSAHDPRILIDRGRLSDQETLRKIAARMRENIELHLRLHAFRGDGKLKPSRQSDDAAQNSLRLCAIEVQNEAAV